MLFDEHVNQIYIISGWKAFNLRTGEESSNLRFFTKWTTVGCCPNTLLDVLQDTCRQTVFVTLEFGTRENHVVLIKAPQHSRETISSTRVQRLLCKARYVIWNGIF